MARTTIASAKRWGRVRRRHLWPFLGPDVLTELRILTPAVRHAFLDRVDCGAIRPVSVAAESFLTRIESFSADDYLKICRICYAAAYAIADDRNSERLYRAFADGRHGGLLSLPRKNRPAFARWFSTGVFTGTHPFEIVRDQIVLSIHTGRTGGYWLRLACRRRDFIDPYLIPMALGLSRAGIGFGMENLSEYRLFARGDDWVGVTADEVWEGGCLDWPVRSGILDAPQDSVLVSELAHYPAALSRVRWYKTPVKLRPLP